MNSFKTFLLMVGLIVLFMFLGHLIGGQVGMIYAFILACAFNFLGYWFSDKIVLAMYGARLVTPKEAGQLHKMIDELCTTAKLPKPKVYIIPTPHPNAFATGRSPNHAAVAVTEGLMQLLSPDELKGVLAHELAHIKNRDILISTIAAILAGAIMILADIGRFVAIFKGGSDREHNIGHTIGLLIMAIVAPLAAMLIQFAISRAREYMADEHGAKMCYNPLSLANALRKLAYGAQKIPLDANPATSHMFIVKPFSAEGLFNLFSTHPPIKERIKRLEKLAYNI